MQALEESGQLSNTLVIFASDNGGDRGSMANNGPTRGAKGDMFEGGIHVPCALNMPGVFEGGRRDNHFVVMMDLMPTICDFVNVPVRHEIVFLYWMPLRERNRIQKIVSFSGFEMKVVRNLGGSRRVR